ncbi:hypothetical protein TNIN_293531 [Trichonephila inaurata madagascariensis]|uniref:Uncharacterized protein n=1 Tax=Trichonephila inaurata madagascariensis TaxID=2747483 RepID=A0A8X6XAR3_9ARAC|nr:hypothetical protein TNIN_293531 [Trichonephila inaurata madagascariensis]
MQHQIHVDDLNRKITVPLLKIRMAKLRGHTLPIHDEPNDPKKSVDKIKSLINKRSKGFVELKSEARPSAGTRRIRLLYNKDSLVLWVKNDDFRDGFLLQRNYLITDA